MLFARRTIAAAVLCGLATLGCPVRQEVRQEEAAGAAPDGRYALIPQPAELTAGDGGSGIWPYLIGFARAREFLYTGEMLTAQRAAERWKAAARTGKGAGKDEHDAYLRAAEALGLGRVWLSERFDVKDAGVICAAALSVTERLRVATAATNLWFIYKPQRGPADWLKEHLKGLVGAGISVYTAFLAFGAVRLMPELALNPALWAVPLVTGVTIILYHWRKIGRQQHAHARAAHPA